MGGLESRSAPVLRPEKKNVELINLIYSLHFFDIQHANANNMTKVFPFYPMDITEILKLNKNVLKQEKDIQDHFFKKKNELMYRRQGTSLRIKQG